VLGMKPLLHPFTWQGLFIPILPVNLQEYLEAPVPFIIGVQELTLRRTRLSAIIVNLDADTLTYSNCSVPATLPEQKKLVHNMTAKHRALYDPNNRNHNPFNNTGDQLATIHHMLGILQDYIYWLAKKIEDFFDINPAEISDSLSVDAFKQHFLKVVSAQNRDFIKLFLDSQMFANFMHTSMGPRAEFKKERLAGHHR